MIIKLLNFSGIRKMTSLNSKPEKIERQILNKKLKDI